ncbi:unnamed protein product, partial [Musa hybrid cultivar]
TLRSKSGNLDTSVFDYFDVVAGIDIGGVFVVMLFATRDGAHLLFRRLFRRCLLLLCAPPHHLMGGGGGETTRMMEAMERVMKEAFGNRLMLCNIVKPILILCYNLLSSAPLVFSRVDTFD